MSVVPLVGKARHVKVTHTLLTQADNKSNVILLGDAETGAQDGRDPQTLQKLLVQEEGAVPEANLPLKAPNQAHSSVEHGISLVKGDVLGHVVRHLAQS